MKQKFTDENRVDGKEPRKGARIYQRDIWQRNYIVNGIYEVLAINEKIGNEAKHMPMERFL